MNLIVFVTVLSLFHEGHAAKCMSPSDARYLTPTQSVPDEWKATRQWHTGNYFPAPEIARPGGIQLTAKSDAARMWWLKDGESELYMILTHDQGSILCTLIGAGLQVGWSRVTKVAKRSGYCHWIIKVHRDDPSRFQMRNSELSEIPEIGPVYLNKTGLYFDYGSNSLNDPLNHVDESLTWWKWERDENNDEMAEMSVLPDQCELGISGLPVFMEDFGVLGRSIGGKRKKTFKFTSSEEFAQCGRQWFLHGMKCYKIFTAPGLPFWRTERACKYIGGRIVLPETYEENRFVRALCRRYAPRRRFWIRAKINSAVARPGLNHFKDNGKSLLFSPFSSKRVPPHKKCAQFVPGRKGRNWIAQNCGDRNARVLCERDAVATEQAGSTRCGRIQFSELDHQMSQIYRGEQQAVRIVNGDNARAGQLPWQAALRFKEVQEIDGFLISHYCGAVLIDSRWALSAAHCFHDKEASDFYVRLGDLHNDLDEGNEQDFDIERLFVHEEYTNQPSHRNDVALIKLNRTANFTEYVQPACLPTPEFLIRSDGERCQVSGWGVTDLSKGQASAANILQYVTVPTMPNNVCSLRYNKRRPYFVEDLMFCAGYRRGGKDSCSGDSGGPYVCRNIDGRYAVAGIVSFGIGCAHKVYPGVYANVRHYVPWISEKIRANGGGDVIS